MIADTMLAPHTIEIEMSDAEHEMRFQWCQGGAVFQPRCLLLYRFLAIFLGVISDAYCIIHLIGLTPIHSCIIPILISEEYGVMTFLLLRIYELAIWKFFC